jgi:hypothetical protein
LEFKAFAPGAWFQRHPVPRSDENGGVAFLQQLSGCVVDMGVDGWSYTVVGPITIPWSDVVDMGAIFFESMYLVVVLGHAIHTGNSLVSSIGDQAVHGWLEAMSTSA